MKTLDPDAIARALIYAPHGRDAAVAAQLLDEAEIPSLICVDLAQLESNIDDEAAFVLVTEEALHLADLTGLEGCLRRQPAWSDLPFIVLTHRGATPDRNPNAKRYSDLFGNITFLERPFHPVTFASVARTAFKGRQRQFEARGRIEELHEGEERLRTALTAGRLGSWTLDIETRTLTTSSVCKSIFGRTAEDAFTYDDLLASIHPDDRDRMQAAVRFTIESGEDYSIEYKNIWPDGSVHWAQIHARLVRDRKGQNPQLVGVSSDITDRKIAEERLRGLNETLEDRVAERTAQLEVAHAEMLAEIAQRQRAEDQLRQAQKMEVIGQLTGGVAHDFNNLLMAVLGNLELLRKYIPNEAKTRRLIDGATQGAQRGAALTQRLLAFARQQDLKVEPTNLVALIEGMTDLLERSAGMDIELKFAFSKDLAISLVDANQVELAVLNLVVNARDAMPHGGTLNIAVDRVEFVGEDDLPAGHYGRIIVSDTGSGMDAETLKKATEPFFSTKELGKGTGLGLSMIHGLAVQLKGALRLRSEVGHGTQAELWLPATMSEAPAHAELQPAATDFFIPKKTILIVDDDPLIAMSTVDMLEDLGHDVLEADSGENALAILANERSIDLLITDYKMPKMNGIQLAAAVRELRPDLPILLATGYAELSPDGELDIPRIAKPFRQDQLAAEIKKVLDL